MNNNTSKYLRNLVSKADAKFNEIFLVDKAGANVAAYPLTSDYWQGDEAKFIESFNGGDAKVYIGELEYDQSTNVEAVQISFPILYNEECIGILIVGVKLSHIEAERLKQQLTKSP